VKMGLATALVLATGLAPAASRASVWDEAVETRVASEVDPDAEYEESMREGDQATRLAASESSNSDTTAKLALKAARAYERAAAARPTAAEPHWRAGMVLWRIFVDCDLVTSAACMGSGGVDEQTARRIIGHFEKVSELSPLDPRLPTILFERALMRTRLATEDDLAHARDDYETLLATGSSLQLNGVPGLISAPSGQIFGNLAETYMMLGDLDSAIVTYKEAVLIRNDTSMMYGLAIAYDRDEQGAKAKEIIAALGDDAFESWSAEVEQDNPFYVPEGEVFYYKGLINEALGHHKQAVVAWKRFLDSGAHPRYQPRARAHLDALKAKLLKAASTKQAAAE